MKTLQSKKSIQQSAAREATFGVVDIGSNTVHLLVARTNGRSITPLVDISEGLQLGANLDKDGEISPEKVRELAGTLLNFKEKASEAGVSRLALLATQAIRMAANREAIYAAIWETTQLPIEILTPQKEAELAFKGANAACPSLGPQAMVDIGGGSMQIAVGEHGKVWSSVSLPLGALRVSNRFLPSDPPTPEEGASLRSYLHNIIPPALPLPGVAITGVLGVGGTLRSIPRLINMLQGEIIPQNMLDSLLASLGGQSVSDITTRFAIKPERARLLLPALLTVMEVLRGYSAPFIVSDYGLREGALLDIAQRSVLEIRGVA